MHPRFGYADPAVASSRAYQLEHKLMKDSSCVYISSFENFVRFSTQTIAIYIYTFSCQRIESRMTDSERNLMNTPFPPARDSSPIIIAGLYTYV